LCIVWLNVVIDELNVYIETFVSLKARYYFKSKVTGIFIAWVVSKGLAEGSGHARNLYISLLRLLSLPSPTDH
jgi:hypothetical protein